jgi:hypothetical protein
MSTRKIPDGFLLESFLPLPRWVGRVQGHVFERVFAEESRHGGVWRDVDSVDPRMLLLFGWRSERASEITSEDWVHVKVPEAAQREFFLAHAPAVEVLVRVPSPADLSSKSDAELLLGLGLRRFAQHIGLLFEPGN